MKAGQVSDNLMELMEEVKGYSDSREEGEELEETATPEIITITGEESSSINFLIIH